MPFYCTDCGDEMRLVTMLCSDEFLYQCDKCKRIDVREVQAAVEDGDAERAIELRKLKREEAIDDL